jgi:hypothetical protein
MRHRVQEKWGIKKSYAQMYETGRYNPSSTQPHKTDQEYGVVKSLVPVAAGNQPVSHAENKSPFELIQNQQKWWAGEYVNSWSVAARQSAIQKTETHLQMTILLMVLLSGEPKSGSCLRQKL